MTTLTTTIIIISIIVIIIICYMIIDNLRDKKRLLNYNKSMASWYEHERKRDEYLAKRWKENKVPKEKIQEYLDNSKKQLNEFQVIDKKLKSLL